MPWKYLCLANAASCSLNQLHFFTSSFGLVFFGLFFLLSILKNNFKCCLHQSTHPGLCYPHLLIPCDKKIFCASLLVFLSVFTYIRASYAVPASNTNLVKLSCAYPCKAFTLRNTLQRKIEMALFNRALRLTARSLAQTPQSRTFVNNEVSSFVCNNDVCSFVYYNEVISFGHNNEVITFVCNNEVSLFVCNNEVSSFVCNYEVSSFVCNNEVSLFVCNNEVNSFVCNNEVSSFVCNNEVSSFFCNNEVWSFVCYNEVSWFVCNNEVSSFVCYNEVSSFVCNCEVSSFVCQWNIHMPYFSVILAC